MRGVDQSTPPWCYSRISGLIPKWDCVILGTISIWGGRGLGETSTRGQDGWGKWSRYSAKFFCQPWIALPQRLVLQILTKHVPAAHCSKRLRGCRRGDFVGPAAARHVGSEGQTSMPQRTSLRLITASLVLASIQAFLTATKTLADTGPGESAASTVTPAIGRRAAGPFHFENHSAPPSRAG